MTDTTNTPEPPLPEPTYAVTVNGVRILTFTDGQMVTYGDARAAHAVAQMQGDHPSFVAAIHWPDCWDVAAYPTPESALAEVYEHFRCTMCDSMDCNGTEPMRMKAEARKLAKVLRGMTGCSVAPHDLWTCDQPDGDPFVVRAAEILEMLAAPAPATAEQPQAREITDAEIDALRAENAMVRAENFRLAAGQCPMGYGDEGGTPRCCAEKELDALRTALICACNAMTYSQYWDRDPHVVNAVDKVRAAIALANGRGGA